MPIRRLQTRQRSRVLWLGQPLDPTIRNLLEGQGLKPEEQVPPAGVSSQISGELAAVVFVQSAAAPLALLPKIRALAGPLLDHGCLVFVLAQGNGFQPTTQALWQRRIPYAAYQGAEQEFFDGRRTHSSDFDLTIPHVRMYPVQYSGSATAAEIAQYAPRYSPAADLPDLFDFSGIKSPQLSKKDELLLRRCFHDCSRIHLREITEGHSGAYVFIARVVRREEVLKPSVTPFFVKIGPRSAITHEWRNYERLVQHRIPFHLAPRLDWGRCEIGSKRGALVGDFVDQSESLTTCIAASRASMAIAGLFDRTMREWQGQSKTVKGSLYAGLRAWSHPERTPNQRLEMAHSLGAKQTFDKLIKRLKRRREEEWEQGPIHGDLHSDNIQVRGNDAILIDFLASRPDGPVLADPAALEVSIVFRIAGGVEPFKRDEWKKIVIELYKKPYLTNAPTFSDPRDHYGWISTCVCQIRQRALASERAPGQYAAVLAYRLLYFAAKNDPPRSDNQEFRRAMAFVIAEQLLRMWP